MKKSLLFNTFVGAAALLLQLLPASGQTPWSELELSNPRAKISAPKRLKYSISPGVMLPLRNELYQKIEMQAIQNAVFEPGTREQLFEKLGGPFLIGPFSNQSTSFISLPGRMQPVAGIQLGISPLKHLEIQAGIRTYRSEWHGDFPVQVMQQGQTTLESRRGNIIASASGVMLNMEVAYFLSGKLLQPFVEAGANWQTNTHTKSSVAIENIAIPVKTGLAGASFSLRGGAGLRANAGRHVFIDAACAFGKIPGGRYAGMAELALGWRF